MLTPGAARKRVVLCEGGQGHVDVVDFAELLLHPGGVLGCQSGVGAQSSVERARLSNARACSWVRKRVGPPLAGDVDGAASPHARDRPGQRPRGEAPGGLRLVRLRGNQALEVGQDGRKGALGPPCHPPNELCERPLASLGLGPGPSLEPMHQGRARRLG